MRNVRLGPIVLLIAGYAVFGMLLLQPGSALDGTKCTAKKLRAAGKYNNCRVRAEARAAARGVPVDSARIAECDARFDQRWDAAESSEGSDCATLGDRESVRDLFATFTGDLAASLSGNGGLPVCSPRVTTTTICFTGFVSTTITTTTTRIEECRNGMFDPDIDETDVDCGGFNCRGCGTGGACNGSSDCASRVCSANVCQAPTCEDGHRNGNETATDCGGGGCPGCPDDSLCFDCTDCASRACDNNRCQPSP